MDFVELKEFILTSMLMSHMYQPVMLMMLLGKKEGRRRYEKSLPTFWLRTQEEGKKYVFTHL
jgi:hypothetical protein